MIVPLRRRTAPVLAPAGFVRCGSILAVECESQADEAIRIQVGATWSEPRPVCSRCLAVADSLQIPYRIVPGYVGRAIAGRLPTLVVA